MIPTKKAYASWAKTYDSNKNRTRDLELRVGQSVLGDINCRSILEIGCGTGKNTEWLLEKTEQITAIDFSVEMLETARKKVSSEKVIFAEADINQEWNFASKLYDLITFSLVLEHIEFVQPILAEAVKYLAPGGKIYICELHPYKHLTGSAARFDTPEGINWVESYCHHISEFTDAAFANDLTINHLGEWFDDDEKEFPRLISLVFE